MTIHSFSRSRTLKRSTGLGLALLLGTSLVACSADAGATTDGASEDAVSVASLEDSGCGSLPGALPEDPDGVLANIDEEAARAFEGIEFDLRASKWADTAPNEGPWKIGYSALPITGAINQAYLDQMEKRFAEAKEAGLVEGDLQVNLMPDPSSMSPAQQLQGYQSLVSSDVDGILVQAFAPAAMVSAVDAAGEAGIVSSSFTPLSSPYAVASSVSFYQDAGSSAAAVLGQLGGKGKVLVVNGIEGIDPQVQGSNGVKAALGECPDIEVVAEIPAMFTNGTSKTAVQNFLASYPGDIDAVLQLGGMATGVINAFEQVGREIPLVSMNGASAGALTYWNENKNTYSSAGVAGSPEQQADAVWEALIRTLAGNGPKANYMPLPPTLITSENVDKFAVEGADQTSDVSMAPGAPYVSPEMLDPFFATPGTPLDK